MKFNFKAPVSEQVEVVTKETEETVLDNPQHVKENEAEDFTSNKKTDEQSGILLFGLSHEETGLESF